MGTPTQVCVRSCPNISAPVGRLLGWRFWDITRGFVQGDGLQALVVLCNIMPPRMRTQSAGRPAAESLGGGTGVQVGRGGTGRRPRKGNDERVDDLNGQGNDQGKKERGRFKRHWIEKMELVYDMSGCSIDQKVKYTTGSFSLNAKVRNLSCEITSWSRLWPCCYTDRIHDYWLGMVAATEPKTIQKAVQIFGALTDEAVRNGSIKKVEKRGNVDEPNKDKNGRDDNKRTRTGNAFATTVNPVGRENTGTWPKCTTCNSYHAPGGPCRICFNCNRPGHLARDYRGVPRNMNPVNARNSTVRACYECGSTDHGHGNQGNQARGRAFMLGAEEASQDSNIVVQYKAEIICHEKVARIPLPDGKVLRVVEERPEEKARFFMGVKKQEEIVVVRDFPEFRAIVKSQDEISLRRGYCDNCALSSYTSGDSILLTPLCCDDIHEVTPRVSALTGCDNSSVRHPTYYETTTISNDIKIDLSKEFLVELRKNMYHGIYYEDVVDHIAKVLKMVYLIYVPGVDSHQLRMKVFSLSLADDAKEWWISDGDENITTWEELVEKFFYRFDPESYDREDEMLDEGDN
ncbi:putative reverse transcriptase domain-containing protein [Tanacetum coccineum]